MSEQTQPGKRFSERWDVERIPFGAGRTLTLYGEVIATIDQEQGAEFEALIAAADRPPGTATATGANVGRMVDPYKVGPALDAWAEACDAVGFKLEPWQEAVIRGNPQFFTLPDPAAGEGETLPEGGLVFSEIRNDEIRTGDLLANHGTITIHQVGPGSLNWGDRSYALGVGDVFIGVGDGNPHGFAITRCAADDTHVVGRPSGPVPVPVPATERVRLDQLAGRTLPGQSWPIVSFDFDQCDGYTAQGTPTDADLIACCGFRVAADGTVEVLRETGDPA